jgi:hypothetical protein
MVKESLSFKEYLENYSSDNVRLFCDTFSNRLHQISNTSSSKRLMYDLNVANNSEFMIFRRTYLDFYKLRLTVE